MVYSLSVRLAVTHHETQLQKMRRLTETRPSLADVQGRVLQGLQEDSLVTKQHDLLQRLRSGFGGLVPPVCDEAANEIERLTALADQRQRDNASLIARLARRAEEPEAPPVNREQRIAQLQQEIQEHLAEDEPTESRQARFKCEGKDCGRSFVIEYEPGAKIMGVSCVCGRYTEFKEPALRT